jgi:hypothetical protein
VRRMPAGFWWDSPKGEVRCAGGACDLPAYHGQEGRDSKRRIVGDADAAQDLSIGESGGRATPCATR